MPYPVLPPALPPVVNVVQPEESNLFHPVHSSNPASLAAADPTTASPAPSSATCTDPSCSVLQSPDAAELSDPTLLVGQSDAALLGAPITLERAVFESTVENTVLQLPSVSGASQNEAPPAVLPTALLQVPDLDTLIRTPSRRLPRSSDAATARTTPIAQGRPATPTGSATTSPAPTNQNLNDGPIRLDLPIPDPTAPPESGSPASESEPSDTPEPSRPRELEQIVPSTPLPAPLPQEPAGTEITIPTPPPRTRSEEQGESPAAPGPTPGSTPATVPIDPQLQGEVLEVRGNRQELDERRQVFRADGDVVVRFRQAVLTADRVRINTPNRVAVAEGNALLTRGDQVLGGERFEFNFGLNQGAIQQANGQLVIPTTERDFNVDPLAGNNPDFPLPLQNPITERVSATQPFQVLSGAPGLSFGVGDQAQQGGTGITRFRFEAEEADFVGGNLVARNVRITNDPFSPPELELRSNQVTYTRLSPTRAEIRARNPRLVFDQGFSLPLLVNRLVLDERQRDSGFISFGFDEEERGGFFIQRNFNVYSSPVVLFSLAPQLLVQRAIDSGNFFELENLGLVANAEFTLGSNTSARAVASFSSLNPDEVQDNLRASFRARQVVLNHTISAEYSYRDRLFNGSLGFQDIQTSAGLVVTSPSYILGDSLINLTYQASAQYVEAQTDQLDLYPFLNRQRDLSCIDPDDRDITGNGCVGLFRFQGSVNLSRLFFLWSGQVLPATPTEGLRYSPTPIFPYLGVNLEARGVYGYYSNGDTQSSLRGGVSLLGQFGNFSKPVLDYTAFSLGYYNTLIDGQSPFLFDRVANQEFAIASLTQQIYGPFRAGVLVSYDLQEQDVIDTVFTLEYSRRTYSISANYSTGRQEGALTLRLNDFNWTGTPEPFSGPRSQTIGNGPNRGG
jgi:Protein of unknown function (DUF3769)